MEFHLCTEEDFKDFAPPTPDAQRILNAILSDPNRGLYCVDWERYGDFLSVWGISSYQDFQFIELTLVPCNYLHTWWGNEDSVSDECIRNRDQQMAYLGNIRAQVYITEQVFSQNQYGD